MAKKSDFAQKLLDDLRMRKEQLAMGRTHSDESRQPYHGSRDRNVHINSGRENRINPGRHKSSIAEYSSKDIVPIRRAQRSEYIADLHMALAFALENGGRLGNFEFSSNQGIAKVFSHHFGRQSINYGELDSRHISDMHRSSIVQFPALSHLHIREISKGAQKLNQILKACSKGVNCDRYSINIGKELLRGAIDLEESLRMLVNLQEASEYKVSPRKKKLELLELEDEDESKVEVKGQMSSDRPRFSFDGSSRKSPEDVRVVTKTSPLKQKLLTLNSNTHQLNPDKHSKMNPDFVSHRRSASCDLDSTAIAAFSSIKKREFGSEKFSSPPNSMTAMVPKNRKIEQPNFRDSEQLKGRIPNVIAKLMGLEELPPKTEPKNNADQKAPGSKKKTVKDENLKQKEQYSTKEVLLRTNLEKPISSIDQHVKGLQARTSTGTSNVTLKTVHSEGNRSRNELRSMENMNSILTGSQKPTFEVTPQMNMSCTNQAREAQVAKQDAEGRGENTNPKGKKNMPSNTPKPIVEIHFQRKVLGRYEYPEAADSEESRINRSLCQKEEKNVENRVPVTRKQQVSIYNNESQQPHNFRKSQDAMQEAEQNPKVKLQRKDPRQSDAVLKNSLKHGPQAKPEMELRHKNQTAMTNKRREIVNAMQAKGYESSTCLESNKKSINGSMEEQRTFVTKTEVKKTAAAGPSIVSMDPMHIPTTQKKVQNTQAAVLKREKNGKTEETRNIKVGSPSAMVHPLRQLNELKQIGIERINKTKEAKVSIRPHDLVQHSQHKATTTSPSHDPVKDEGERLTETDQTVAENTSSPDITSKDSAALQLSEISFHDVQAVKTTDSRAKQPKGTTDNGGINNSNFLQQPNLEISNSEKQGLLEDENHLKQILIKSQYFLNAAEALFKLQIPVGILHASCHKWQDKDSKPLLDCGYEIMKRKGRREEFNFHPSRKLPIVSVKVKCLDDLIKELNEDLNHLKLFGEGKGGDYDAAGSLHEMLKRDIENRNPDVNCMWDFGWKCTMFGHVEKDEVIRELEKHVLNRLIDEITGDLLQLSVDRASITKL
ncbi:uncharacterized protein LOC143875598 [Tasmannia lanceolata]|uniref:uncharacterized protein LOC143875598 n=1 Tax=Tasmannia lanceolata TaxID=3420 RepID=UPI004064B391